MIHFRISAARALRWATVARFRPSTPRRAGLLAFYSAAESYRAAAQNYLLQTTVPINNDGVNVHVLHTINAKFSLNGGYNLNSQRQNTFGSFLDTAGTQSFTEPVRDAGPFAQLDAARGGKYATELEPQPQANPER